MLTLIPTLALSFLALAAMSQSTDEQEVAATVEALRKVMIDPDESLLQKLTHSSLSYGHSSGKIENREAFIKTLMTGESDFRTLVFSGQTIEISGSTAIVRHRLSGDTHDKGKDPGTVNIGVMLVFVKEGNAWKLIGRQAYKL